VVTLSRDPALRSEAIRKAPTTARTRDLGRQPASARGSNGSEAPPTSGVSPTRISRRRRSDLRPRLVGEYAPFEPRPHGTRSRDFSSRSSPSRRADSLPTTSRILSIERRQSHVTKSRPGVALPTRDTQPRPLIPSLRQPETRHSGSRGGRPDRVALRHRGNRRAGTGRSSARRHPERPGHPSTHWVARL
jgi:hypothetical protein